MSDHQDLISFPIAIRQDHRLIFTRDVFDPANLTLANVLTPREPGERVRALVFWDHGLATAFPGYDRKIINWFAARGDALRLVADPIGLVGGETVKNDFSELERCWAEIERARLCRHSYVIAVGGGALLDLVGFAAGTAHRGIPLVRLPTTSLSQGDGGVGVKQGINYFGKKNWLGSFGIPHAVINDLEVLHGLPVRDRRAGLIEAVKVSLIRDANFFHFIEYHVESLARLEPDPFEAVIRESARQHLEHIATAGDPFERGSARPLDFGHWAAHKLEQLSDFEVTHGEAVAIGMAIDLSYAKLAGILTDPLAARILRLVERLGFDLYHPALERRNSRGQRTVLEGLEEFREHLGGRLSIPMIRAPGDRLELHTMDSELVNTAIDELARRNRSPKLRVSA